MSTRTRKLISPDLKRCQAEIPNGHTFMTLGGSPGRKRCLNTPILVVFEVSDIYKGQMSLCGECLLVYRSCAEGN